MRQRRKNCQFHFASMIIINIRTRLTSYLPHFVQSGQCSSTRRSPPPIPPPKACIGSLVWRAWGLVPVGVEIESHHTA